MSKVYNKAFKVGFGFNILIFAVVNLTSFINAHDEAEKLNFNSVIYSIWGFPTEIYTTEGAITGGFIIATCGFVTGFIFKYFLSDFFSPLK